MRASSHSSFVAEKYGSGTSPVRARRSSAGSSRQRSAVRRSCQTIAGATALPVARCQRTVVSRWLAIPIACELGRADAGRRDGILGGAEHGRPDLLRVVLDPARARVVLRKLPIATAARDELVVHDETGRARRPLVDREDHDARIASTRRRTSSESLPGDRQRRPPAEDVLRAQRPLALARVQDLRLDLRDSGAERLERACGDHLVRERAVGAGQVRGERRVELRMPPQQGVDRDVRVRGARERPRPAVDAVQIELGAERVQHRQRDAAVRRQLPACDRDHAERAGRQHRLPVRPRRVGRARRQHANAGEARAHVAQRLRLRARARPRRGSAAPPRRSARSRGRHPRRRSPSSRAAASPPRGRRTRRASGRSGP